MLRPVVKRVVTNVSKDRSAFASGSSSPKIFVRLTLNMKTLRSYETWVSTRPTTGRNIRQYLNLKLRRYLSYEGYVLDKMKIKTKRGKRRHVTAKLHLKEQNSHIPVTTLAAATRP
jgi:hypothetical protein